MEELDASTATAWRPLQERPAALARRPKSSASMGFFCLRSLRLVTCFLRAAEQANRLSLGTLCWIALAATGTKTAGSFSASRMLLRWELLA